MKTKPIELNRNEIDVLVRGLNDYHLGLVADVYHSHGEVSEMTAEGFKIVESLKARLERIENALETEEFESEEIIHGE